MPDATLTHEQVLAALEEVMDPELGASLVALDMIKDLRIEGEDLSLTCELTTPACPLKDRIETDIRAALARRFPQLKNVRVNMTGRVRGAFGSEFSAPEKLRPDVKNVVLVTSGRGGAGKTTVAVNLALALRQLGAQVSLLDLDFYTPTVPELLGLGERPGLDGETRIRPVLAHGLEVMSMGLLMEPRKPLLWRGPVLHGLVAQFLRDVSWSPADYLFVDLPSGGEMALEAARACAPAGAVLVAANSDQRQDALFRVKGLLDQLGVSVFGLLENLAGLNCPSCGRRQQAFPKVGARVAQEMGVPLLGEIPVELPADPAAPRRPALLAAPNGEVAHAFLSAAGKLAAEVSKRNFAPSLSSAPAADPPASDQKDP